MTDTRLDKQRARCLTRVNAEVCEPDCLCCRRFGDTVGSEPTLDVRDVLEAERVG